MFIEGRQKVKISDIKGQLFELRENLDPEGLEELANSIKESGQIQPIVLRKTAEGLFLVAGARRLMAARRAGKEEIEATIISGTEIEAFEIALSENVHRKEMTPGEVILALKQASNKYQISVEELLERIQYKRTQAHVYLKLMQADQEIIDALVEGKISLGVAYEIAKVPSRSYRKRYLEYAINGGATAQAVRNWRQQEAEAIKMAVAEEHGIEVKQPERTLPAYEPQRVDVGPSLMSETRTWEGAEEHFICLFDRQRHHRTEKRIITICEKCYNHLLTNLEKEE